MDESYHPWIQALHWLIALAVIGLLIGGLIVHYDLVPKPDEKILNFLHMGFGLCVLVLMVVRLFMRGGAKAPPLPVSIGRLNRMASHVTQVLFYVLLLAQPVFGILFVEAHGTRVPFFGLFTLPMVVGKSQALHHTFAFLHFWTGLALIVLVLLHVAGALYHHARGEPVIRRMMPRRS